MTRRVVRRSRVRLLSPSQSSPSSPVIPALLTSTSLQSTTGASTDQDAHFRNQCVQCLPALRRFAWTLTDDRFTAEDLVQDTIVLALRNQHRFTPGTNMRAWLFTIMRNQRANDLRRTIRQGLRIDPSEVQEPRAVSGGQEANEEVRDMCRALAQLSESTRAVVLLAGCHQFSYGEIVDRLKIPIGTVRSRLVRGRRLLREVIADEHIDSRTVGYKSDDPADRSKCH